MGHFDTKSEIEAYVRTLPIRSTIIRPSAFMEILTLPGMGLNEKRFSFFMHSDQKMQFIAVEDIARIVARIFDNPVIYAGQTLEIAGDAITGDALAASLSRSVGETIAYARFPDDLLRANPFLGKLAELVDDGRLAGRADLNALRDAFPGLVTFDQWLAKDGAGLLRAAMSADTQGVALR